VPSAVPALTGEVVEFIESGVSILVGTRDAALHPACTRAAGARVDAERGVLTLYLPQATAERTLANLRDNAQIAITFSRPITHRSLQIKGTCKSVRPSDDADRLLQERYRAGYMEQLQLVGIGRSRSSRMVYWPSVAVDVTIGDLFVQTPGPGAGRRLDA
jgi:hypothetical protein